MKQPKLPGFTAATSFTQRGEEYRLGARTAEGAREQAIVPQFCTPCLLGHRLCCNFPFGGCRLERC